MKTRIWKSAGRFVYMGQTFEAQYRADERELCEECEGDIVSVACEEALPRAGRRAVGADMAISVTCRHRQVEDRVQFTIVPAGEMAVMATDYTEAVVDGFIANASHGARWLSRIH